MRSALSDIAVGVSSWRIWGRLGWHDILSRYRRSAIGPLWLILTLTVFIAALSIVYGTIFRIDIFAFIPIVAVGMLYWNFFAGVVTDGPLSFVESEIYIKQVRQPLFLYVCRVLWRHSIIFGQNIVVVMIVILLFKGVPSRNFLLVGPGLLLFIINAGWIVLLSALLGARFRDIPPLINTVLQTLFFITPIFWPVSLLGDRRWIADVNIVFHIIEVVRAPMLSEIPSLFSYIVVVAFALIGWSFTLYLYGSHRKRVVYWL